MQGLIVIVIIIWKSSSTVLGLELLFARINKFWIQFDGQLSKTQMSKHSINEQVSDSRVSSDKIDSNIGVTLTEKCIQFKVSLVKRMSWTHVLYIFIFYVLNVICNICHIIFYWLCTKPQFLRKQPPYFKDRDMICVYLTLHRPCFEWDGYA